MKRDMRRAARAVGYTLVELSVSTSILALLAVGGLSIVQKKGEADAIRDTEQKIRSISTALDKFIRINGYVPCPADPALPEDREYFGRDEKKDVTSGGSMPVYDSVAEACVTDNVTGDAGMLPVRTLNLPDEMAYDGWERKFSYKIASRAADKEAMADPSHRGDIRVVDLLGNNKTGIDNLPPNNQGALYVLISHGANGAKAAWPRTATSSTGGSVTPPDKYEVFGYERQNMTHTRGIYVQDRQQESFDDILHFSSKYSIKPPKKILLPVSMHEDACSNAKLIKERPSLVEGLSGSEDLKRSVIEAAATLNILCAHTTKSAAAGANMSVDGVAFWFDAAQPTEDGSELLGPVSTWVGKYGAIATLNGVDYGGPHHINGIPAFYMENKSIVIPSMQNGVDVMGGSYVSGLPDSSTSDQLKQLTFFIAFKTSDNVTDPQTIMSYGGDNIKLMLQGERLTVTFPGEAVDSEGVDVEPNRTYTAAFTTGALGRTLVLQASRAFDTGPIFLQNTPKGQEFRIGSNVEGFEGVVGEFVVMNRQLDPKTFYAIIAKMDEKWKSNFNFTSDFSPVQCPYQGQEYISTSKDPERRCQCPEGKILNNQMDARNACVKDGHKLGQCVDVVDYQIDSIEQNISAGNNRFRDPRGIGGLLLWLDAADCTTIELDKGRRVVSWRDKSNNRNNFYSSGLDTAPSYDYISVDSQEYGALTFGANNRPTYMRHEKCAGGGHCKDLDIGGNLDAVNSAITGSSTGTPETGYSVFIAARVNMASSDRGKGTTLINHGEHHWGLKLDDHGRPFNYARIREGNGNYAAVDVYNPLSAADGGGIGRYNLGKKILYENELNDGKFHIFHGHAKWKCDANNPAGDFNELAQRILYNNGPYDLTDVFLDNKPSIHDRMKLLKGTENASEIQFIPHDEVAGQLDNLLKINLGTDTCWSLKSSDPEAFTVIGSSDVHMSDKSELPFVGEIGEIIVTQTSVLRNYEVHQEIYRYLSCKWQGICDEPYGNAQFR